MPSFWILLLLWCVGFLGILLPFIGLTHSILGRKPLLSAQYVSFAEIIYSSSDKCISQCFFWITVTTHTTLPSKFGQVILCKFIVWYQSRREINTVKQRSGQARKTGKLSALYSWPQSMLQSGSQVANVMSTDLPPFFFFFQYGVRKHKIGS